MRVAKPGGHAVYFILITILIDTIGFGIIIPVWPQFMMQLTHLPLGEAARYGGYVSLMYASIQFFSMPLMGNLSDRFGRRPILLFSLGGLGLDFIVMGLAPNLSWLFVSRSISGVLTATYSTASAYIADVTPPEKRAANFGLVGAAFGLGFVIGPALGGIIADFAQHPPAFVAAPIAHVLQLVGFRAPFFAAATLSLVNVLYGAFVLPESLAPERRRPFALLRANPVGALLHITRHPSVAWMALATFFFYLAHNVNPAIWTYYVTDRFHWSTGQIGLALGAVGLAMAIVSGLLTGPLVKLIGERGALYLGFSGAFAGFLIYAFATKGWMIYAAIPIGSLMGVAGPSIRGIMTKHTPPNEQGELSGALGMLMSLTFIVTPVLYTQTFALFTTSPNLPHFAGAPFIIAALCIVISGYIARIAMRSPDDVAQK